MGVVVFEKMWLIVILDTREMDTKKQFPESVLWTILKHYWNEFQYCKNITAEEARQISLDICDSASSSDYT